MRTRGEDTDVDDELRAELLRRHVLDQEARAPVLADYETTDRRVWDRIAAVDRDNMAWLAGIIDAQGWPLPSRVGSDAADIAWLIVQHADDDPAFQRRCLDLIAALPGGEVEPSKLAMLTDRVLLNEGRPQRYGTQAVFVNGQFEIRETEDPDRVDDRRAAVGLAALADHLKRYIP